MKIALIDDHHVVRKGLRIYLESFADIQIVGEANTAEEAIQNLAGWNAD